MRNFHYPGRSPVYGRRAMCATSHPLASLTAIDVLKQGGNAVDAAIATAAVLAVVEPPMTGIGGDCFALLAKGGETIALSAAGRAPAAARPEWFAQAGIARIEATSAHAVTVPGAVAGWCRLLADHGTMPLEALLAPAIGFAQDGFAVAPRVAHDWAVAAPKIARHAGASSLLLRSGRVPRAGEVMRFPTLAATLRRIAKEGRDGFYRGPVAADMVTELRALGGLHSLDDFARQDATYVRPIGFEYGGLTISELPPSNQGIVALMMLKMLTRMGLRPPDPLAPARLHVLLEAARLAYAMRDVFLADPAVAHVDVEHMLSDGAIDALIGRIDPGRRMQTLLPVPRPQGSDTVCFAIVDSTGLAVSFINSLYAPFGSGIAAPLSGILFHNRGEGFVLDPEHPNAIAPGKRPMHTLAPGMGLKGGVPALAFGVMGAHFQPMGHVYVLSNLLDYGMDPQEAIDAPRVFFEGDAVVVEEALPASVLADLRRLGHRVEVRAQPWGGAQLVAIDPTAGILIGASDGRKDGMALGF